MDIAVNKLHNMYIGILHVFFSWCRILCLPCKRWFVNFFIVVFIKLLTNKIKVFVFDVFGKIKTYNITPVNNLLYKIPPHATALMKLIKIINIVICCFLSVEVSKSKIG